MSMRAIGLTLVICLAMVAAADVVPSFPEAEGFGANTPGGRGGQVLLVTTLEDYVPGTDAVIPGSLRAACDTPGPRIVVFRVGGIIELKQTLQLTEPFITIAGQSAPGDGVCLTNYACVVSTHDVVIRYLRCRPGDEMGVELDALSLSGSRNVVLDHCSTSWSNDETLSVSGAGQTNITVQWCFITESLDTSHHSKGSHGYGTLLRTDGNVTFHHNLYAHHRTRCPRPGTYGEAPGLHLDFRNNVVYNWMSPAGYSAEDAVTMNYVGNYLKPGPSSTARDYAFSVGGDATKMYVEGNVVEGVDATADNWVLVRGMREGTKLDQPIDIAVVATDPADEAFRKVLETGGATLPVRDSVDGRIVQEIADGTGRIINTQTDVGGWPEYRNAEPPADGDGDGMPDAWETAHGLNPSDPADAVKDADGDGYTNIEEWINGLGGS
ncbi:MAG: pectate lyase [bacterium]|nr:pectate lyase [bacterium]